MNIIATLRRLKKKVDALSNGISRTNLSTDVQTSLAKADTAVQTVKVNGTTVIPDTGNVVDINNVLAVTFEITTGGTIVCDTTIDEIFNALESGKYVCGIFSFFGEWILRPVLFHENTIAFSVLLQIGSDDGIIPVSIYGNIINDEDVWNALNLDLVPIKANVIESILVNGKRQPVNDRKEVEITLELEDITQHDYSQDYLTFTALQNTKFTFSTNALQYSLNDGATWTTLAANTASPTVTTGNKILWKQAGLTPTTSDGIGTFSATGNFEVSGNIMSLYYGDNFIGQKSLTEKNYAFYKLFNSCNKVVNASNLILPATTLANQCYDSMFSGCTSLTTAPELPATTLAERCYARMFYGCTSLNYIKCLAIDISASSCTYYWVKSVSASGTFVKSASMLDWTTGIGGIPTGWNVYTEEEYEVARKYELGSAPTSISTTYSELKSLRDNSQLIPGFWYRITDYECTTSEEDTMSARHQFDILVLATSVNTLSEEARAIQHEGDTYFANSNLNAWKIWYCLDNDTSRFAWANDYGLYPAYISIQEILDGEHLEFQGVKRFQGSLELFYGTPEQSERYYASNTANMGWVLRDTGNDESLACTNRNTWTNALDDDNIQIMLIDDNEFSSDKRFYIHSDNLSQESIVDGGKGVVYRMIDEWNNDCPYDFKNIQFKRYLCTDSVDGRSGLNGMYMACNPLDVAKNLSVDDPNKLIFAYTFSSDNGQEDYSLTSEYNVHDNIIKPRSGGLPNNVMYGGNNYGNTFGNDCYGNSFGNDFYNNSLGGNCCNNSFGNSCCDNSLGDFCSNNSLGDGVQDNSWGVSCNSNSWFDWCCANYCGNNYIGNSLGEGCSFNSWGNDCSNNSWGNYITDSIVFNGVQYTQITTTNVKNVQVLSGIQGTSSSKLTLTFAANKTCTQVAALNSSGQLKIYVPGDLVQ